MDKKRLLELAGIPLKEGVLPTVELSVTVEVQLTGDVQLTDKELKNILKNNRELEENVTSAISRTIISRYGNDKIDGVGTTIKVK